jgi:hypothetical protein
MFFNTRIIALRHQHEWFNNVTRVAITHFKDRYKMREAERSAIASECPEYNINGNPEKQKAISKRKKLIEAATSGKLIARKEKKPCKTISTP